MQTLFETLKTQNPEQALRRAIVFYGKANYPEITLEKIKGLITKANVNAQDDNPTSKRTALHLAIINNQPELVRALLAANAHYDIEDAAGKTPLCYAANTPNIEIKKLVMNALASDTVAKVASEFKYVSDEERAIESHNGKEFQSIIDRKSAITERLAGIFEGLMPLLTIAAIPKTSAASIPQVLAHQAATKQILDRFNSLNHLYACNLIFQSTAFRINFCGLMDFRLYNHFYKHKAIRNGKIQLSLINLVDKTGANHALVLLNGAMSNEGMKCSGASVLCNPSVLDASRRTFIGEKDILQYFMGVRVVRFTPDLNAMYFTAAKATGKFQQFDVWGDTTPISFGDLLYAEKEFSVLFQNLNLAYFESIQKENPEHFANAVERIFVNVYEEAMKNGTLDALRKFTGTDVELDTPALLKKMSALYVELKSKSKTTASAAVSLSASEFSNSSTATAAATKSADESEGKTKLNGSKSSGVKPRQ